jgi:hypothetical protein
MTHTIILILLPGVGREYVGIMTLRKHIHRRKLLFFRRRGNEFKTGELLKLFLQEFIGGYLRLRQRRNPWIRHRKSAH